MRTQIKKLSEYENEVKIDVYDDRRYNRYVSHMA